ncbi:molybdenum ABC transporter permease subunit [Desulfomarina profundi]|uniref:Molybdenum transport system permease n=1 Tax=Desulfomarina profundi TaxID=2772557 RepID=A0A8D5FQ75_9BACT|nr:molybdate ABC transporter permease subunit [Desulfomarina profundi]BCL62399.1 molybdenum ABC transporter permease subunit [Desulfomarina profundi]
MISLTPQDTQAVLLSIKVATAATLISLPFGFGVACIFSFTRIPGRAVFEGIVNLPLVLPPIVTGYLLLLVFGSSGVLGPFLEQFGITVVFTAKGAVIASAVVGFPLLVRSIRIGMDSIKEQYLQAARTLGAPWWDIVVSIIIPLSARAIIGGMTLMFARSLGEFGATIILAGNIPGVSQTIPLAIYDYTSTPGQDSMALVLCAVSISLSFFVLLVSEAGGSALKWR